MIFTKGQVLCDNNSKQGFVDHVDRVWSRRIYSKSPSNLTQSSSSTEALMKAWFVPGAPRLRLMSFWISKANPSKIILPTWVRYTERGGYSKNIDEWIDRCPGDEMCRSYRRNFDIPRIGVSSLLVLRATGVTITILLHAIVDVSSMCLENEKQCLVIICSGIRTMRSFEFLFQVEVFENTHKLLPDSVIKVKKSPFLLKPLV